MPCPRDGSGIPPTCPPDEYFENHPDICQCLPNYLNPGPNTALISPCDARLAKVCTYPGEWNPQTCICDCHWWTFLTCQANQYFDPLTCKCRCKEHCKDCSVPQIWNENVCNCVCPYKKRCAKNQYWSEWSCDCQCKAKPRRCCENKVWSSKVRI